LEDANVPADQGEENNISEGEAANATSNTTDVVELPNPDRIVGVVLMLVRQDIFAGVTQ
jgi:hypothetical protein